MDSAVWNTLSQLNIKRQQRGCRSGVKVQRSIKPYVDNTRTVSDFSQAIGVNTSNLIYLSSNSSQTIPVISSFQRLPAANNKSAISFNNLIFFYDLIVIFLIKIRPKLLFKKNF